jgi:NADH-quinone oxidoreductase subunit I
MRATSPSGAAAFEGVVQWSGELGHGVRPPEGGQSDARDDAATGTLAVRDVLENHLYAGDRTVRRPGRRLKG